MSSYDPYRDDARRARADPYRDPRGARADPYRDPHDARADPYRDPHGARADPYRDDRGASHTFQYTPAPPPACDESYYMHASSDDFEQYDSHEQPRGRRVKRFFPLIALLVLGAIITAVAVTVRASGKSADSAAPAPSNSSAAVGGGNGSAASNSSASARNSSRPTSCPTIAPSERTVVFWQSEVDGCEKIPVGVTHVVWGFALVADGVVVPTFQNTDAYIMSCIKSLRSKCISSLGSIGGSTNNRNLSAVTDVDRFAASAAALVTKFGFDGIDLDDETVGAEFSAARLLAKVQATRAALRALDPALVLTYDAYFSEGRPTQCRDPALAPYSRCFPAAVLPLLDWVNIMAYNVDQNATAAAAVYDAALATTFADWRAQLGGDFSKATIGVCAPKSCAYGPGPSAAVVAKWNAFARASGGGGMMVYAASSEAAEDFPVTRSVVDFA